MIYVNLLLFATLNYNELRFGHPVIAKNGRHGVIFFVSLTQDSSLIFGGKGGVTRND